jgi:hypothetical protein
MNSVVYNGSRSIDTKHKKITAVLTGTATTYWGLTCYLKGPSATLNP